MNTTYTEPTNEKKERPSWLPPKIRLVRSLLYLIVIGLAIHILLPQITSLKDSINVLRSMSPWMISLAFLAQIGACVGRGYVIKAIADLGKTKLSLRRGVLIAFGAGSIGLVGGLGGSVAATYRWIAKREDNSEEAVLAGTLPQFFNEIVLVLVTIVGLLYLLLDSHLSRSLSHTQVVCIALALSLVILVLLIIIYAMQHQAAVEPFILRTVDRLMHFLRRTYDPASLRNAIDHLYRGLALLDNKGWLGPTLGAAMNVVFDILSLYFLFIAAGYKTHPGVLLPGYGLAFLFGKVAYIVPGGVGVVEGGLTAIYSGLGVPKSISIVVILSYRLLSFWIPTLLGFAAAGYLEKQTNSEDVPGSPVPHLPRTVGAGEGTGKTV